MTGLVVADHFTLRLSVKNKHAQALGRKGGKARAARLSKEERAGIAKKAAAARWAKPRKPR